MAVLKNRAFIQAVLAESEAKRSAHAQELEGIRASREQVEAQLAQAEARLKATQAALAEVMQPDLFCNPLSYRIYIIIGHTGLPGRECAQA